MLFLKQNKNVFKLIEEHWPLSYVFVNEGIKLVPLKDHLISTGKLMECLFSRRFKYISKLDVNVSELLYTAGALHDLGKASRYYINIFKKIDGHSISFYLHEYIMYVLTSYINTAASTERGKSQFTEYVNILGEAIVRHHVAMGGRHPAYILIRQEKNKRNKLAQIIFNALKLLDPQSFIKTGYIVCGGYPFCKETMDRVKESYYDVKNLSNIGAIIRLLEYRLKKMSNPNPTTLKVIQALSGALIIADNISALYERTSFEKDAEELKEDIPSFTAYWLRELYDGEKGRLINCLKNIYEEEKIEKVMRAIGVWR